MSTAGEMATRIRLIRKNRTPCNFSIDPPNLAAPRLILVMPAAPSPLQTVSVKIRLTSMPSNPVHPAMISSEIGSAAFASLFSSFSRALPLMAVLLTSYTAGAAASTGAATTSGGASPVAAVYLMCAVTPTRREGWGAGRLQEVCAWSGHQ
jgi:hypothetical protein